MGTGFRQQFSDDERRAIGRAVLHRGPDAVSRLISQVGNAKRPRLALSQPPTRETPDPVDLPSRDPLIDVFVEPDILILVADLPNHDSSTIDWRVNGDTLTLIACGRDWLTVALPERVGRVSDQRWRNGLLTLQLEKAAVA